MYAHKTNVEAARRLLARAQKEAKSESDELFLAAGRLIEKIVGLEGADLADDYRILEGRLRLRRLAEDQSPTEREMPLRR